MYQQIVDTLLIEKLLNFWVLLRFWFKRYYISGFYYNSGSKVTTFLVLLHFCFFTTFLGLTACSTLREDQATQKTSVQSKAKVLGANFVFIRDDGEITRKIGDMMC